MSNYLIVVGKKAKVNLILNQFKISHGADESQFSITNISNSKSFLIFEKRPEHFTSSIIESKKKNHGLYFRGQALDHDSNSMILGLEGFSLFQEQNKEYHSPMKEAKFEGSFILARWNKFQFSLQNDLFSIFRILYYCDRDVFISSDSLLMITKCMRFLKIPVEMDLEVARSKAWSDIGTANAPLGEKTIVKDVFTICAGKWIVINFEKLYKKINPLMKIIGKFENRPMIIKVEQNNIMDFFETPSQNYEEVLLDCARRMYSNILFTVKSLNSTINFGLSGGLDSRIILALCLKSNEIMEHLIITTSVHPSRKADFDIVKALSKKYNFTFNKSNNNKSLLNIKSVNKNRVTNPFGFWILNSLGSYDAFYLNKTYYESPSTITMLGVGAEAVKQTMDKMKIRWKGKNQHPSIREAIISQMNGAVKKMGVDPDHKFAMKLHYIFYKMTYHLGQKISVSNFLLRPFVQRSIISISMHKNNPFKGLSSFEPTLLHDLLIIINPKLAKEPFDSTYKDLSSEYIEKRIKELNVVFKENQTQSMIVFGEIEDISNGPAPCFLNIVKQFHWSDNDTYQKQLIKMVEEQYDKMNDVELKELFKPLYNITVSQLNDESIELSISGSFAARFLQFYFFE